jgi:hypothetical protein
MVVRAAIACRLESQPLELGGDVPGRELSSPGARATALERIVSEELQVGAEDRRVDDGRHAIDSPGDRSGLLSGGAGYWKPEQG